jgi:hypothetical protein
VAGLDSFGRDRTGSGKREESAPRWSRIGPGIVTVLVGEQARYAATDDHHAVHVVRHGGAFATSC